MPPTPTATGTLGSRLRARRPEIEQATLARACSIADPAAVGDPGYAQGLREAVSAAVGYGLSATEPAAPPPVPSSLLVQARAAARNQVPLDTVLRRYVAGYALLEDFLLEIAEHSLSTRELKALLRRQALLLDRLMAGISEEYGRELEGRALDSERRRGEVVRMLLTGEPVDVRGLDYEFCAWHLGLVVTGPNTRALLRDLATALDRSLLVVQVEEGVLWAWLGGRRMIPSGEVLRLAESCWDASARLVTGEPGEGIGGWRWSHRQAKAALPVASRSAAVALRYSDVALLAAALGDEILAASLRDIYMAPMREGRDGGETLRQTLAAYFKSGRNMSCAASILGVSRKTVSVRLQDVEELLGRLLGECAAELETALRLYELENGTGGTRALALG